MYMKVLDTLHTKTRSSLSLFLLMKILNKLIKFLVFYFLTTYEENRINISLKYFLSRKDVRLPVHLQRAMAAEAEAAREARAKVSIYSLTTKYICIRI